MDKKEYRDIEELVYEAEELAKLEEFAEPEEVILAGLEDELLPAEPDEGEQVEEMKEEAAEAGETEEAEEAEESPETDAFGYEDKPQGLPCCGCAPLLRLHSTRLPLRMVSPIAGPCTSASV